ncbi:hypothetical protein DMN91_012320 [Ooceraea biroi]|uniref:Protein arginine N-methyltransferase n=1 Tax=Ooceraea biroi TaxID=2015173 RepID=A0A3L8D519_OOCBI|nr:hypothetical protein DMN91_012320 [Ooceraea biroi]
MTNPRPVSCGLDFCSAANLNSCLAYANDSRYDFVCVPLVHPLYKREFISGPAKNRRGPFTRPDLILNSSEWSNLIIGKVSPFINVDSTDPVVRKNSEKTLTQELSLASHFGLSAVWVQVPMENPIRQSYSFRASEESPRVDENPWEWWNTFRAIDRWLGEPVRCLVLPTTLFLTNKKGYPVLSKAHQAIVKKFAALEIQFILTGATRYQSISYYHNYLDFLWKSCQTNGTVEKFARGYEDYLQCPLQPLSDNLESQTYEIFEKDPVKYREYQNAIYEAIKTTVSKLEEERKIIIMVVGAGRGPLVTASLNAGETSPAGNQDLRGGEEPECRDNPGGDSERRLEGLSHGGIVRHEGLESPEKADIIVSELLGSFGDNELSRNDGINIPQSYTSYIAPVQSSKLYNEVKQLKDRDKHPLAHFEALYVVHLQNKYDIAKPRPVFTFTHPNADPVADNSRYETITFPVEQNCSLHGFSGYFTAILYKNIALSIEPSTYSTDMFSWFPLFFPLKVRRNRGDDTREIQKQTKSKENNIYRC